MNDRKYAAIDLHANNLVCVVTDEQDRVVRRRKLAPDLAAVLAFFEPFRAELSAVAVESTYNWYWLVDGLQAANWPVKLAHPGAIEPYAGQKHRDDKTDARHLCRLQRLNDLPTGYIYPASQRPVRDLLRRRRLFVGQHTAQVLSLQGLFSRQTGQRQCHAFAQIQGYDKAALRRLLGDEHSVYVAQEQLATCHFLETRIAKLTARALAEGRPTAVYPRLLTLPGVGPILGLTILYETGELGRFRRGGNFASYCRLVPAASYSNGRRKGRNNSRNGNAYLAWAFVEAANIAIRRPGPVQDFFNRKLRQHGLRVLAIKATAAKLARAAYFIMRDQVDFQMSKAFG